MHSVLRDDSLDTRQRHWPLCLHHPLQAWHGDVLQGMAFHPMRARMVLAESNPHTFLLPSIKPQQQHLDFAEMKWTW